MVVVTRHTNKMGEVDPREEEAISSLVFHLGRELRTALDRRLTGQGGTSQQAALLLLSRLLKEPSPIKDGGTVGTDTAGIKRLLDRLVTRGLIIRRMNAGAGGRAWSSSAQRARTSAAAVPCVSTGQQGPSGGIRRSRAQAAESDALPVAQERTESQPMRLD